MKKVLRIFLIATAAITLLAGCKGDDVKTNADPDKDTTGLSPTITPTTEVEDSNKLTISDSIYWINGTHAILTTSNNLDIKLYGGMEPSYMAKSSWVESLDSWWGITNKEELLETVTSLREGMHNPGFLDEVEQTGVLGMTESEFKEALNEVENPLDVAYFQNLFDAHQQFGDNAIMAWDLSRATQLLSNGYIAEFITYEEAISMSIEIGKQIQETFNSWDDFIDSYMYGYLYWSEDDIEDPTSGYVKRMKIIEELKADTTSPFHLNWNMTLE